MLKPFVFAAASLLMTPIAAAEQTAMPADAVATDTRLAAVLIYADWCGSCQVLDPKVAAVKADGNFASTTFVTLDYTDRDETAFFAAAEAANVDAAVADYLAGTIKTGQLLLIDLDDAIVVATVKKDMSEAEITAAIASAEVNA